MYMMKILPYKMMGKVQYLPMLEKDDKEVYRGEYQATASEALARIERAMERLEESEES
jgi:hypothetical protein